MFDPASHESAMITAITWKLIVVSAVIYAIVCMVLIRAAARHRDASATAVDLTPRPVIGVVWFGAIIPVVVLVALFLMTLTAMRRYPASDTASPVTYHVTAHQWWWDVAWIDPVPGRTFHTANEIHVAVGRPARIILTSDDVIHTFWVPQLQGKIDLIPGDTTEVRFTALQPGVYRGQCAEYCGAQHAHMALVVVAEPPAAFADWVATEADAAAEPRDSAALTGRRLVVTGPCAVCHTIRGTAAAGAIGPDLTHVGSRLTLAAGALPNNIGTMEAWITSAQSLKPGVAMPSLRLFSGDELRAVAAYLEGLR
ncbi:MAG TPA: cytochrome c oxidase subunit II [Gemmatimonadales bacterium]